MAVSIMSALRPASLHRLYVLAGFLQVLIQGQVFEGGGRQAVFLRSRRANNLFMLEEILEGNLERECYEERCNYEEARECFEDTDKTNAFWTVYYDGNQCDPNPCLHGGNCTDLVGGFHCSCPAPHYGPACELGADRKPPTSPQIIAEFAECPTGGPTACHQLCTASYHTFTCSCMAGFRLQKDGRSCVPEVAFPCGQLPDKFNKTAASLCRHGNCPWQVSLLSSGGVELCSGVVLGRRSVLTAARCLLTDTGSDHRPSNFFVLAGGVGKERILAPVQALFIHNRFRRDHHENDLVLLELAHPLTFGPTLIHLCLSDKDFSENILMHSGRPGVTRRRSGGRTQKLVYMELHECRRQVNVSHPLSNKMFCMKRQNGASRAQRSPNRYLGNQNGTQGSPNGHTVNQTLNEMPNGSESSTTRSNVQNQELSEPDHHLVSEISARRCGGLLPGAPVATVQQGTAYLTGLLMSCDDSSGSLVFTKLSRYLNWIRPRLEAAKNHMTQQVSQYPGNR